MSKNKKLIFTEDDYNSNDGMSTYIWGPPMWHTLHTLSFNYPINPTDDQKKYYLNFYSNLVNILPCKTCRDNLKKNFEKNPLNIDVFKNRNLLSRYIYNLHEIINIQLGKKSNLSYEKVRDIYEMFRARSVSNIKNPDVGCVKPLRGVKSKCILNIVPRTNNNNSLRIDSKCIIKKKTSKKLSKKIEKK